MKKRKALGPVPVDSANCPNVKDYEFGAGFGTGPNGGTQTRVRVHTSPKTGEIHVHPVGPEKFLKKIMNTTLSKQLSNDIREAYGSLVTPNWSFKEKRSRKTPYSKLVEILADAGTTQETTDLNDDVSVVSSVDFGGDGISVRLSLVGKYACINNGVGRFLSRVELKSDDSTNKVLDWLTDEGIIVLEPEDLTKRIDFGQETASVYEVLFSRDEAIE